MALPNVKEIKKIADSCRKAGISSFKCADFEFTLTPEAPVSNYKKKASNYKETPDNSEPDTGGLSDEDILFWSSGAHDPSPDEETGS